MEIEASHGSTDHTGLNLSFTFSEAIPELLYQQALANYNAALSEIHRARGGSGLALKGETGANLPLRLDTATLLRERYAVHANVEHAGITEVYSKNLRLSVLFVDPDSPLRSSLLPNSLLTERKGVYTSLRKEWTGKIANQTVRTSAEVAAVIVPRPNMSSPLSRITFGAHLRHEVAHAKGADEFEARTAEREYMRRQGMHGPSDKQIFLELFSVTVAQKLLGKPISYDLKDLRSAATAAWNKEYSGASWFKLAYLAVTVRLLESAYCVSKDYWDSYVPQRDRQLTPKQRTPDADGIAT